MTDTRRVSLAPAQEEAIEVELDGRLFAVRSLTRSAQKKVEAAEDVLEAANDTDSAAHGLIGVLSALTVPTGGQRKTAGDVLTELWDNDKLTLSQLSKLVEDLREVAVDRPT